MIMRKRRKNFFVRQKEGMVSVPNDDRSTQKWGGQREKQLGEKKEDITRKIREVLA